MGSVEMDELQYDGGSYGMSQELIDMEHAELRKEAREHVEELVQKRDMHALTSIHDSFCNVCDEVYRLVVIGRHQDALDMLVGAVDDAVDAMVGREIGE